MDNRLENISTTTTEEINELLEWLTFSEEEAAQVVSMFGDNIVQGFESWVVGKIMVSEVPNREAMCRVFRSLCRILNLLPWLFDRCLFSMLPFGMGNDFDSYEFWLSPFWLRIYNIPIELMDRQLALDVGNTIGELVVIDWKDRYGGWIEFMRIKVKIDMLKPLRRVVRMVDKAGEEKIGLIKYERLPDFCYACGVIDHTKKTCKNNEEGGRGLRRNRVELVVSDARVNEEKEESQTNLRADSEQHSNKGKEKACEDESMSISPMENKGHKTMRGGVGRMEECLAVCSEGKSRGLALLWREDGFQLKKIVVGDVEKDEKYGEGHKKPKSVMDEFGDFPEELNLTDVKTYNGWFTWTNKRDGNRLVKERLDRYDIFWAKEQEARDIITSIWSKEECNPLEKMAMIRDKLDSWKYSVTLDARGKLGHLYDLEEKYWATRVQS
ncbi:hypothetical protein GOBAR_AA07704 [Gossypium barbadense]|uniref:Zinc knuckle CX2CX4HX4C domain-containing protein n=1 Tax=Gossypium barbadense TaxID=3634 RepID=A0A2P5YBH9_GOSBA|nr:hypothetical protein GOBAR_AA07704 [Gossypium barbadense]